MKFSQNSHSLHILYFVKFSLSFYSFLVNTCKVSDWNEIDFAVYITNENINDYRNI